MMFGKRKDAHTHKRGDLHITHGPHGGEVSLVEYIDDDGGWRELFRAGPSHGWVLVYLVKLLPLLGTAAEAWDAALGHARRRKGVNVSTWGPS